MCLMEYGFSHANQWDVEEIDTTKQNILQVHEDER